MVFLCTQIYRKEIQWRDMETTIDVNTGKVKLGVKGTLLRSVAIGSCIVIVAYDIIKKMGAMAHIMLPGKAPKGVTEKTKYASDAIDELLNMLIQAGSERGSIEVCLVGGGNVLKRQNDTICKENIESVIKLLAEKQIPIKASILGGTTRKGVFLDVENGKVTYTESDSKSKLLWQYGKRLI